MSRVNISREDLARALRIYWKHAWPSGVDACPALPEWDDLKLDEILDTFIDESEQSEHACRRFVLRLGNHVYPHMKFAVEQCLHDGDFYFLADCHDDALHPVTNDAGVWEELRKRNYGIKLKIEADWKHSELPTFLTASKRATGSFKKPEKGDKRILVVDDEPANVALTSAMLQAQGYGTETAGSGDEGLERTNEQKPDLIISDYEMPGMTGRDFARKLKDDTETREIPILICTYAEITAEDLKPADALLRRPFSQEELRSTVKKLLGKKKAAS